MNLVGQLINKSIKKDKLNILGASTHETFNTNLSLTGHNFIFLNNWKKWDSRFRKVPPNISLLKNGIVGDEVNIDVIVSEHKVGQYQNFYPLSRKYNIPLVQVEHCWPVPSLSKGYIRKNQEMKGDVNIFITETSRKAWGFDETNSIVINHMIDTEIYKPNDNVEKKLYILSVCNQFSRPVRHEPCGHLIWKEVIRGFPWFHLGADDPGFSEPAKDLNDLIFNYQSASIFINTSQYSPIPMSLLEAAACGLPIISTSNCEIPFIFEHGHDALLSNDIKELRGFCEDLLKDEKLRIKLGNNARETIKAKFPSHRFINAWNDVFEQLTRCG